MYKEIFKLKELLEKSNIPFEFTDDFFNVKGRGTIECLKKAYQIVISRGGCRLCDAIQHHGSYGNEEDLLEIMGGLTVKESENDNVLGYLTAEEVFKRFKYCYENNTKIYKEEEK